MPRRKRQDETKAVPLNDLEIQDRKIRAAMSALNATEAKLVAELEQLEQLEKALVADKIKFETQLATTADDASKPSVTAAMPATSSSVKQDSGGGLSIKRSKR